MSKPPPDDLGRRRHPSAAPAAQVRFAHHSERLFASLLDLYAIDWVYEPVELPLVLAERERDDDVVAVPAGDAEPDADREKVAEPEREPEAEMHAVAEPLTVAQPLAEVVTLPVALDEGVP